MQKRAVVTKFTSKIGLQSRADELMYTIPFLIKKNKSINNHKHKLKNITKRLHPYDDRALFVNTSKNVSENFTVLQMSEYKSKCFLVVRTVSSLGKFTVKRKLQYFYLDTVAGEALSML